MNMNKQQVQKIDDLYLSGTSIDDIAVMMNKSTEEIMKYIPVGEVGLAYEKVILASKTMDMAELNLSIFTKHKDDMGNSISKCNSAQDLVETAIKDMKVRLKALESNKKQLKEHIENTKSLESKITDDIAKLTGEAITVTADLELALADKKETEENRAKKMRIESERLSRQKRAESMAEEAIIGAAITAAKEVVAERIGKRLEADDGAE